MGGNQPPFRMPCGGLSGEPQMYFGCQFQQDKAGGFADHYIDTSTVLNPVSGMTVSPYTRYLEVDDSAGSCESGDCNPASAPCSLWEYPFTPPNFTLSGDPIDFRVKHKMGFKNVFSRAAWHGRFGFLDHENLHGSDYGWTDTYLLCDSATATGAHNDVCASGYSFVCSGDKSSPYEFTTSMHINECADGSTPECEEAIEYESYQPTFARKKYIAVHVKLDVSCDFPDYEAAFGSIPPGWNYHLDYVSEVDPSTGRVFAPLIGTRDTFGGEIRDGIMETLAGSYGVKARDVLSALRACLILPDCIYSYSGGSSSITISNTKITASFHADYSSNHVPPTAGTQDVTIEITLDEVAGIDDSFVVSRCKSLLAQFPLNDDALYPWRTDQFPQCAPLLSYWEKPNVSDFAGITDKLVDDFSSPLDDIAGRPYSTDPDSWYPTWEKIANADPAFGEQYVAIDLSDIAGGDHVSIAVGTGGVSGSLTYTMLSGCVLPPGLTFNSSTNMIEGTCTNYDGDMNPLTGNFGATFLVEGDEVFDGRMLGVPNPAGYQNQFDYNYVGWLGCITHDPDSGAITGYDFYRYLSGRTAQDYNEDAGGAQIPLNATQIINFHDAINKSVGAFAIYADKRLILQNYYNGIGGDSGWCVFGKYAEIIDQWPSANFARPAGWDKFLMDETKVYGIDSPSGSGVGATFTSTDYRGNPVTIADSSGVWISAAFNGCYTISVSGTTVTLVSKVFDLPSGWQASDGQTGDDSIVIGRMRWSDKPSLLGAARGTMSGTTFTFTEGQPTFGMDSSTHQEQVDIWSGRYTTDGFIPDSIIATNVTATRIDDSSFSLASHYDGAAFVTIYGAAKPYVNDNRSKGDAVVLDWMHDFRTNGERGRLTGILDCSGTQVSQPAANDGYSAFNQTQLCVKFEPCEPKVVCVSPNGENFPNGITIDFPEIKLDERYGTFWQAFVMATMTDPFYQTPHIPFGLIADPESADVVRWLEDDGTCQEDYDEPFGETGDSTIFHRFYPVAPQVEARVTVPDNYGEGQDETPTLASGITVGFSTTPAAPSYIGFQVDGLPAPIGETAWMLHQRFCDSQTGDCRFATYYAPMAKVCG